MQGAIARYRDLTALHDGGEIPALNGVRALLVLFVAAFHIWQQSWLTPHFNWFGTAVSLDPLLRSGYMWVDGLLLLSSFLCYLPHAWAREAGRAAPPVLPFYRKRLLRIVPGYLLNILVLLAVVVLPQGLYRNAGDAAKDILAHATFTHTLFSFSYYGSPINGALWTLGVEMQFYLIFPLLARAMRRMPLLTSVGMMGAALVYRAWVGTLDNVDMWFNQLPAFLDVYAIGFMAASIYVSLRRRMKEDAWTRVLMSVCALAGILVLARLVQGQASEQGTQMLRQGQMDRRFLQAAMTALCMLGLSLGLGGIRLMLGNPLTRFLSQVSFQFYMWHQVFAVQLRRFNIPWSASSTPNQDSDLVWQRQYVWLCFLGALAISALITYLVEQPIARLGAAEHKKPKEKRT
ncbi:MAG: acyltransferase family protein [Christensenellales bacterium]